LSLRELGADLVEGFDGLTVSDSLHMVSDHPAYLVSDQGLLDRSQILQRRKEHVTMFRTSHVLDEVS
jgi:hypothetical protein